MSREVVVLGTSSQVPTRERSHVSTVLRWDDDAFLFDPGEGTQRQMLHAGVSAREITQVCITHLHGDHCLGLPGFLGRASLDRVSHPVELHFPASGQPYIERLRTAAIVDDRSDVRERPIDAGGAISGNERWTLYARRLEHRVDTFGYRLEESSARSFVPELLAEHGLAGSDVGRLRRDREISLGGRTVSIDDVTVERPGQIFAFIMDTRVCDEAVELARGADLVVSEATFLAGDVDLASEYFHLTARQAAVIAREAGARRLVLTHYSQRYTDFDAFRREAAEIHPDVIAARDLDVIAVPARTQDHPLAWEYDPPS